MPHNQMNTLESMQHHTHGRVHRGMSQRLKRQILRGGTNSNTHLVLDLIELWGARIISITRMIVGQLNGFGQPQVHDWPPRNRSEGWNVRYYVIYLLLCTRTRDQWVINTSREEEF